MSTENSVIASANVVRPKAGAGIMSESCRAQVLFRNCEGGKECPTFYTAPDGRILVQGDIVGVEERQALGLDNLPTHETLVALPRHFIEQFLAAQRR